MDFTGSVPADALLPEIGNPARASTLKTTSAEAGAARWGFGVTSGVGIGVTGVAVGAEFADPQAATKSPTTMRLAVRLRCPRMRPRSAD